MLNFLFIIIGIVAIHALYNLINFLRYNSIEKLFFGLYAEDTTIRTKSISSKNTILDYIKYAGISDKKIPISQAIGYGQVINGAISIFENITNNRQDVASTTYNLLLEAKGNYWSKFINSFNLFYWARILLFLPQKLFSYLGLKPDSVIIKIFQLIYWTIGIVFTIATTIFPNEVKDHILSFINTF